MNTSVSPLPIPVWPLLGLSLALVSATAAVVTVSSQRAVQQFSAQTSPATEASAPEIASTFSLRHTAARAPRAAMMPGATS